MKPPRSFVGPPLLAALLIGLVTWVLWPARPGLWAAVRLPGSQPARTVAVIASGDPLTPVPREPMAVATLRGGDLLVTDIGLGQVHWFSPDRRLRASYGASMLRYPVGLAVAEDDRVWVADLWQQRIYQLHLTTGDFEELPSEPSRYEAPGGLFYHRGLLYVADLSRHQVVVINPDGSPVRVIGSGQGKGPGQFAYPNAVWVGDEGEVFVSDTNNSRIQVFDLDGRLQRILQPHLLQHPRGIVQDRQGQIYVADTLSHDIAVLDPAGHILTRHTADLDLTLPNGLAIRGQRLFIADRANSRIVEWELRE